MFAVGRMIELSVHLPEGPGLLGKFMASATSCSARILASCCYCDRSGTVVRLVTEDPEKTARALAAVGIGCTKTTVVLIQAESSPTAAARIGAALARANVPMLYSYLSFDEGNFSATVLKTADDARALSLLRAEAGGAVLAMPDRQAGACRAGSETQSLAA